MSRPYVAVVGSSSEKAAANEMAEEVGRRIAEAGGVLVCGGLGGIMEAACRGTRQAGGISVGFLPGDHRHDANEFVDIALPTGMGEMRNMLVVRAADAVIAVSGEFGTLSEIGWALRVGIPVVGLDTWELRRKGEVNRAIEVAETPKQAVERALELARATR